MKNLPSIDEAEIGISYRMIDEEKIKIFNLEERVKHISKNQHLPLIGFVKASIDALKDRPSVFREFAGTSPTKYFGWLSYQAVSLLVAIEIVYNLSH